MKLKMLAAAMACALASVMISESAVAQRRGRNGGGYGYNNGRNCPPRYAPQPRVYYGNNNCAPRYNNRQVYRGYNNCPPRYTRVVRPRYATPPITNVYYGGNGYNQGGYYGGGGVSVNVNTPGFSGSFNSGGGRGW